MLAQRAGAQITLHDNLESQLEEVAYFNGLEIVFVPMTSNTRGIKSRLEQISNKVSRHVVFDRKERPLYFDLVCDLTSSLGSSIDNENFHYYSKYEVTFPEQIKPNADAVIFFSSNASDLHSMYHIINKLNLNKRG